MRAWVVAILAALVLHAAILLFGGVFFLKSEEGAAAKVEEVDLMASAEPEKEAEQDAVEPAEAPIEMAKEAPPEMPEVVEAAPQLEPTDVVARLDALSLGALADALDPNAGGGGFGRGAVSLASGGRIGGTGAPGATGGLAGTDSDALFDLGALDQTPRLVHQPPPVYPAELRRQKLEGTVYVVFVVDKDGRVVRPSVESSPYDAFRAPALAA